MQLRFILPTLVFSTVISFLFSIGSAAEGAEPKADARATAVALNYCRASFHRIRKYPSTEVLEQEREKILNNLNLEGIADPEVIRLYSEVLDEIGELPIVDKEKELYATKYNRSFRRQVGFNILALSLQVATAQYLSVLRTGADSWWDYRNSAWSKENHALRLDKQRVQSVVKKSSLFMDTFWKLSRKKNIPDRWLIRGKDLDKLETAMREPKLETRLRLLKRLSPFMECYPPYWYYVGRTEQQLGKLVDASRTYENLARIETHIFRRDDMLASALANLAVIQYHQNDSKSVATARRALAAASDSWQVNLVCAHVLSHQNASLEAEDAILRNMDNRLENHQSRTALVLLYAETKNSKKLKEQLSDPTVLAQLPAVVLLQSLASLEQDEHPQIAVRYLKQSLTGHTQLNFGADDFLLKGSPNWQLGATKVALRYGTINAPVAKYARLKNGTTELKFREFLDIGNQFQGASSTTAPPVTLFLQYPGMKPIQLVMRRSAKEKSHRISDIRWGTKRISLVPAENRLQPEKNPQQRIVSKYPSAQLTTVTPVFNRGKN